VPVGVQCLHDSSSPLRAVLRHDAECLRVFPTPFFDVVHPLSARCFIKKHWSYVTTVYEMFFNFTHMLLYISALSVAPQDSTRLVEGRNLKWENKATHPTRKDGEHQQKKENEIDWACLEDRPRIDNKSCDEMDTIEWKTKTWSPKNWLDTNSEWGHKERRSQLGENTWVGSRQKDLEGADRPVC